MYKFTEYVRHPDPLFVSQCVLAVGRIASRLPGKAAVQCLFGLMALMGHPTTASNVVADSVVSHLHTCLLLLLPEER